MEHLGEDSGALGAARGTKSSTPTRKSDVVLGLTGGAPNDGEARFEQSAVKVGGDDTIPAALPKTVVAFESLFPYGLDGFVVGFEELE